VEAIKPLQFLLLFLLYVLFLVTVDMLVGLPGHQSRLPKDDSSQRWFKLAQLFQRRRNFYKGYRYSRDDFWSNFLFFVTLAAMFDSGWVD
jgi:hypothetical protein